jgi:hypothetical protein
MRVILHYKSVSDEFLLMGLLTYIVRIFFGASYLLKIISRFDSSAAIVILGSVA